jgi:hypothetical protein
MTISHSNFEKTPKDFDYKLFFLIIPNLVYFSQSRRPYLSDFLRDIYFVDLDIPSFFKLLILAVKPT